MNKDTFLEELQRKLRRLPQDEIETAVQYYAEYFNDAGTEHEGELLHRLGTPAAVASKIIGEYAVNGADKKQKNRLSTLWTILLGICASPIAIPIIAAVFIVAVTLIFSLIVVVFSIGFSGAAIILSGIACLIFGFIMLFREFATGLFFLGYGFFCLGGSTLLIIGSVKLFKILLALLQKGLGKFLIRRSSV